MKTKCFQVNRVQGRSETIETGLKDDKGRDIVYFTSRVEYDLIPAPEGADCYYEAVPGHRIEGRVQPGRRQYDAEKGDARSFGAYVYPFTAETPAQLETLLAKKVASGIARYRKIGAK